jgi:hypothetical protein
VSAEAVSASTEFDIFATKPVQTSTLDATETAYKPIASIDQTDLEFFIPPENKKHHTDKTPMIGATVQNVVGMYLCALL